MVDFLFLFIYFVYYLTKLYHLHRSRTVEWG